MLDSSSPSGHERKYAAVLGMGYHKSAIDAFERMLWEMSESSNPEIRGQDNHIILIFVH